MSNVTEQQRHAMKPTRWVLFMRTFFLYQLIRFVWINLRMLKMIWMSHRGGHQPPVARIDAPPRRHEAVPALTGSG